MTVYLGDYVRTTRHGYRGRVTDLHHDCPEGAAWLAGQVPPLTEEQRAERKWVSVLVHQGGAIATPASDCTVIEPFEFTNPWADFYFRDAAPAS